MGSELSSHCVLKGEERDMQGGVCTAKVRTRSDLIYMHEAGFIPLSLLTDTKEEGRVGTS